VIYFQGGDPGLYQGDQFPVHGGEHLAGFPNAGDLFFVFKPYHFWYNTRSRLKKSKLRFSLHW
jgi:hypothetical protein